MLDGTRVFEKPIRWAMVGGGKGSQIGYSHRSAALKDGLFEMVAGAFDINPERGIEFAKEIGVSPERAYPDYKTMFAEEAKRKDGIEAVSIATPNGTHFEITKAALNAGLHVVCEKPLCFTATEAEEIVKLAKEKGKVVGITYGYAGHPLINQARQMIKNGDLGEIRIINMSFAFGGYGTRVEDTDPAAKWRFDPTKAGPSFALADVGTHPLYLAEAMIPDLEIDKVMAINTAFVEGRQLEDNGFSICTLKGSEHVQAGAQIYCWASSINTGARHYHKIRVVGSKASIEWDDERPNQMIVERDGEPSMIYDRGTGYLYDEARIDDRLRGGHTEGLLDAWSNLYRRFAIAMRGENHAEYKDFWYPGAEAGLTGVKWVEKCVESSKAGSTWIEF